MTLISRRRLIAASSALAGAALLPLPAQAVSEAEINKEPELGDMWLGADAATAKVTIIEYASATCGYCAAFHAETYGQLKAEYIDTKKIRFVMREFPTNGAALAAFMVARAAPKEAYFPLVGIYYETLQSWTKGDVKENLFNIAKQAGFTREKFEATLVDEALAKKIQAIQDGGVKFGVQGTPTFFINGELYDGDRSIEAFRAIIDPLL